MSDREFNPEGKQEPTISLELEHASCVNFASAQNDIPVIRTLTIKNDGREPLNDLQLRVTASPSVIRPKIWAIDSLAPEETLSLQDLGTPLDTEKLSGLNETERGSLTFTVVRGGDILLREQHDLSLLAKDHWGGLADMDRLLAAYVSPNDATVAALLEQI